MNSRLAGVCRSIILLICLSMASLIVSQIKPVSGSTSHDPISITDNSGFTAGNGVTGGSGTADDPYVIEGWTIDSSSTPGILIQSTDAYFTIRDVSIQTSYGINGTVFIGVEHGSLEDSQVQSRCEGGSNSALWISVSYDVLLQGNSLSCQGDYGLALDSSDSLTISGNTINGGAFGMRADSISNTSITGNVVAGEDSMYLTDLSSILISDNQLLESSGGIGISACDNLDIENNSMGRHIDSLFIANCGNVLVSRNNFPRQEHAITLASTDNSLIQDNNITHSIFLGLWLSPDSTSNEITGNNIVYNHCGVYGPLETLEQNTFYNNTFGSNDSDFCTDSWTTFHQNPLHTGQSPAVGPSTPVLRWKFQTGGSILSSPAIAFGTIYVGSEDGNLYALNPQGLLEWKFATGGAIDSSPSVGQDGTVYVGSQDGYLYAIRSDGQLKWSFKTGSTIASSPTVGSDGTVYVGSFDGHLYAINADGTLKWASPASAELYGSPAIASDGTIYVGIDDPPPSGECGQCLEAISTNGTVEWGSATGQVEYASPTIGPDGTIYIGSTRSLFSAVNPDGTTKWTVTGSAPEIFGSTAGMGSDGTVYVTSSQVSCDSYPPGCDGGGNSTTRLYAMGPDGTVLWTFSVTSSVTGSQIFCCLYYTVSSPAVDTNGIIYMGSVDGNMYAVNPDGTIAWQVSLGGAIGSSPTIDFDGTIYVGSSDGNLYAIGSS